MDDESQQEEGHVRLDGKVLVKVKNGKDVEVGKAICLDRFEGNLDTGKVTAFFTFVFDRKWRPASLPMGQFTEQGIMGLRDFGATVTGENRHDVWLYLQEQEKQTAVLWKHHNLGWFNSASGTSFLHAAGIGVSSQYAGRYSLGPAGTADEWRELIDKQVHGRPMMELMLAVGCSSALIHPLENLSNLKGLLVHCWGDSSKGKTTGTQVALSVWGYPETGSNGLLRTWNATENALVASLRGNWGVAIGFDEASMCRVSDFSSLIYTLAEGQEKARLDDQSNFQASGEWRTTVLSTGEFSLLERASGNTGLRVRMLEIGNRQWTDDAAHADILKDGLRRHYGHAGPKIAEFLRKANWGKIHAVWAKWKSKAVKTLPSNPFSDRIAGKVAVVLTAAVVANKVLDLSLDVMTMLDTLVSLEMENPTESVDDRAYEAFQQWVSQHPHTFRSNGTARQNGCIDGGFVYVLPIAFQSIIGELGFASPLGILTAWKKKKRLKADKGKKTVKKVLDSGGGRVSTYAIRLEMPESVDAP